MRTLSISLSLYLLSAAAVAQSTNFVVNGDFSAGLTLWTTGGSATNPLVENADVTGLGVTSSFGCGAGPTAATTKPYPPFWLEQTVTLIPVIEYEFSADVSVTGASGNAHAGLCYVEVNATEVGRIDFSTFLALKPERNRLCFRFTTAAAGPQPLRINLQRPNYISTATTPRMNVTNVSIRMPIGPTFAITDNRQIGKSLPFALAGGAGAANMPYALALAAAEQVPALPLPSFQGLLGLDPSTLAVLLSGTLDASGKTTVSVAVPSLPALITGATWFQGVTVVGGQLKLGFHHGLAFTLL